MDSQWCKVSLVYRVGSVILNIFSGGYRLDVVCFLVCHMGGIKADCYLIEFGDYYCDLQTTYFQCESCLQLRHVHQIDMLIVSVKSYDILIDE